MDDNIADLPFNFFEINNNIPEYAKFIDDLINKYVDDNDNFSIKKIFEKHNNLLFSLKINGDKWNDDFIDENIAKFVLSLQSDIDNILSEVGLPSDVIKIKVKIEKGCKKIIANLTELIKELTSFCSNMDSKYKVLVVLIIALSLIGWQAIGEYAEYKKHELEKSKNIELAEKMITPLTQIINNQTDHSKHLRIIEKSMDDNDTIAINNDVFFIKRETFKDQIKPKRNPKSEYIKEYIDGKYHISNIDIDKKIADVHINDKIVSLGFSELSQKDVIKFFDKVSNGGDSETNQIDLQINIEFNSYKLKNAKLIGMGTPREGSVNVEDIIPLKPNDTNEIISDE